LQLINILQTTIYCIFVAYPLVWAVTVELNLLPLATEMWLFANLDISAKLVLTSVLSNMSSAAYDYDVVDFPKYLSDFVTTVRVPAFAISKEGTIIHWNSSMELVTHMTAAEVLHAPYEETEAFSASAVATIKKALDRPVGDPLNKQINLEVPVRGNPQESYNAPFHVLWNRAGLPMLPMAV
jgi:transcriptional regulator with PAS, ATPase and Fis domain